VARQFHHEPVLLEECLSWLELRTDSVVVDGTVGGGGHAEAILERSAPGGRLIALDVDTEALSAAAERLAPFGERVALVHASFRRLRSVLRGLGVAAVDAVLLDLGVSSHQLDTPGRGFRFVDDGAGETPLDMRMDPAEGASAAELLQSASAEELERWFREYADLPGARRLARAIVVARATAPLRTTRDLLDVIRETRVGRGRSRPSALPPTTSWPRSKKGSTAPSSRSDRADDSSSSPTTRPRTAS
jgi:16S rRNA (cytosine1402-N4)-methyltransferase